VTREVGLCWRRVASVSTGYELVSFLFYFFLSHLSGRETSGPVLVGSKFINLAPAHASVLARGLPPNTAFLFASAHTPSTTLGQWFG
jgi:hypothetical protein